MHSFIISLHQRKQESVSLSYGPPPLKQGLSSTHTVSKLWQSEFITALQIFLAAKQAINITLAHYHLYKAIMANVLGACCPLYLHIQQTRSNIRINFSSVPRDLMNVKSNNHVPFSSDASFCSCVSLISDDFLAFLLLYWERIKWAAGKRTQH